MIQKTKKTTRQISFLEMVLPFLEQVILTALKNYFNGEEEAFPLTPDFSKYETPLPKFLSEKEVNYEELVCILLALVPHLQPGFLNSIIKNSLTSSGDFPELGGQKDASGRGFLPTGETAAFLLSQGNLQKRFQIQHLFSPEHWFVNESVLKLESVKKGEPILNGKLILDKELVEYFTTGRVSRPALSAEFPAEYISTALNWEDLVLPAKTFEQIEELQIWLEHQDTLMQHWGLSKKVKPGYRVLFHGPPGTGKTMTATLLGKQHGLDVFRIDLSLVVSKYIGETEKNLATLFDKAQNKNWILFFDEADALFGKRTNIRDAHDKYANQEVAYLLQRIENYPGLVILATNFRANVDDAFTRRFQSMVHFPFPKATERLRLWQNSFPKQAQFSTNIDFANLAQQFELTGANIINIVQYVCLQAISKNEQIIDLALLKRGIQRELVKEGKVI